MPKPKAKSKEEKLKPLAKSEVLRLVIENLEPMSPIYKGLPPMATLEHRALHQAQIQEFMRIFLQLKTWFEGEKRAELEADYSNKN